MKQQKILFVINNISSGGAEEVFVKEINALTERGYDCSIALIYSSASKVSLVSRLCIPEDRVWSFNFKNLYDVSAYISFVRKIKQGNVDIVYSTLDDANFVSKITRIFTPFKLFCREANMTDSKHIKFKISDIFLNFFVYKLVMVADAVKKSYALYDPFHKNKMTVLYNGVEIPGQTASLVVSGPIRMLAVGSFTKKKGFEDLVSLCKEYVWVRNKNFILEIVGNGPLLEHVQEKIRELGLDDNVRCVGALDQAALSDRYKESHVFVLASQREGCPNVLLEAMAHGLASVAYSVGGVPEIIQNDVSGLIVPPGDKEAFGKAILSLMENHEIMTKIGHNAREAMVEGFSFETHIRKLTTILELHERDQ